MTLISCCCILIIIPLPFFCICINKGIICLWGDKKHWWGGVGVLSMMLNVSPELHVSLGMLWWRNGAVNAAATTASLLTALHYAVPGARPSHQRHSLHPQKAPRLAPLAALPQSGTGRWCQALQRGTRATWHQRNSCWTQSPSWPLL